VSASATNRRACPEGFAVARLAKANGFMEAAELTKTFDEAIELRDACVTLWIHSGIASADYLCCKRLGEHHSSDNHNGAVAILAEVDQELSEHLRRLLRLKTKAGYSGAPASADDGKVAERAATRLPQAARSHQ
jgi:hypothetical protein